MAANAGMVGTTASHRPSFVAYLIRLYSSDLTFRSVADFTVLGTIVLAFLILAPTQQSPSGGNSSGNTNAPAPGTGTSTAQKPTVETKAGQPSPTVKPTAPVGTSAPVAAPTGIAIAFPVEETFPSLANFVVVDINEVVF